MLSTQEVRSRRNLHRQYSVGMARTKVEIEAVQKLRHQVFADELGARLNLRTPGIDRDRYDPYPSCCLWSGLAPATHGTS
jgi:putative hemolysin